MAPHNSTLIHEHEPPNSELKCYSPILPLRNEDDEKSTRASDDDMDADEVSGKCLCTMRLPE
jgi:hypothetical protein